MTEAARYDAFLVDLLPRLGERARSGFADPGEVTYKEPGQPVTETDRAIEVMATKAILAEFPDHRIEGEEGGVTEGEPTTWFIDPIDGTLNFSRGIPFFSVSVGVVRGDQILAGAVLDPLRRELFHGGPEIGAFLGDTPIRVSDRSGLDGAAVSIQTNARGEFLRRDGLLREFHKRAQKTRKLGTIALELAYVACGRMDLLLAGKGRPQAWWDLAGGWAVIEGAGGVVVDLDGSPLLRSSTHLAAGPPELVRGALGFLDRFRGDGYDAGNA